jgi:hypothetical protein
MTVIKDFVTQGVIALPPKENLILRFIKGEGLQGSKEQICGIPSLVRYEIKIIEMRTLSVSNVACFSFSERCLSCILYALIILSLLL